MKRLINWLRFDYEWLKLIGALTIGAIVYGILYATFAFAILPTEKDFSEMETQIAEIQKSPEVLLESDIESGIEDGLIVALVTDKHLKVRFDKDFNVISKCNEQDVSKVKLCFNVVSAILGLFASVAVYAIFKYYMPMDWEKEMIEDIRRKINSQLFNLKLKLKKKS